MRYEVDAAGRAALNAADNQLSSEIVQMRLRLALIEHMRDIVREAAKPLENIDSIRILQVDGLNAGSAGPRKVHIAGQGWECSMSSAAESPVRQVQVQR